MALTFKLWARVEVHDSETDEHTDLDRETCEYKLYEGTDLEALAQFIIDHQYSDYAYILQELKNATESYRLTI